MIQMLRFTALLFVVAFASVLNLSESVQAAEADDTATPLRLYVSVGGEKRIARLALDPQTGELSSLGDVELPGAPGAQVVSRDGRTLYVALRSTNSVAALAIDDATGDLTLLGDTPVAGNPTYLALDQTGKYLFTASYTEGKADVYRIKDDRTLDAEASSIVTTKKNPHSILIDADNRVVYVPNTGADVIKQYVFDVEQGTLTPHATPEVATTAGDGPRHLWFHPTLPVMYYVNEKSSSVSAYRRDKTGSLSLLQNLSTLPEGFAGNNTCADLELTPDGAFLYASNRGHDSIAAFRIDAKTGRLEAIGQFPTETTPRSFNISPDGRFLVAAGQRSGKLTSYRRNSKTGELARLATIEVGKSPSWVQFVKQP